MFLQRKCIRRKCLRRKYPNPSDLTSSMSTWCSNVDLLANLLIWRQMIIFSSNLPRGKRWSDLISSMSTWWSRAVTGQPVKKNGFIPAAYCRGAFDLNSQGHRWAFFHPTFLEAKGGLLWSYPWYYLLANLFEDKKIILFSLFSSNLPWGKRWSVLNSSNYLLVIQGVSLRGIEN